MSLESELKATVRELQFQVATLQNNVTTLQSQIQNVQTTQQQQTTTQLGQISNLIRNGDHSHSVDTWFNTSPSGTNQEKECANIYTHVLDTSEEINDGVMTSGSPTLTCNTSLPFVLGDVGKTIVVHGAGTSGADLITTITGYTSAGVVTLGANAATTVSNARVRFGLQSLGRTNSKNSGSATNDSLKDSSHSNYATNINDPDWQKSVGVVRLGSTNTVEYPLGRYDSAGTTYSAEMPIYPGRSLFVIFNVARSKTSIKPPSDCRFFAGLWNETTGKKQYLEGASFSLSGSVEGTPAATATTQYLIIAETDKGYTFLSNTLSLANAPTSGSYVTNVVNVRLSWTPVPGILRYKIYRKIGSSNVEILDTPDNGATSYVDQNPSYRVDTGSTLFPSFSGGLSYPRALAETFLSALGNLPVDGVGNWKPFLLEIPIVPNSSFVGVTELVLRLGLNKAIDLEVIDAVTNSTATVTSATAGYSSDLVGKTITITDANNPSNTFTGTVASYVSATEITVSSSLVWTSSSNTLTITAGGIRGLLFDLVGLSLKDGLWAHHPEDNTRPQLPAVAPTGSTQGGIGGGSGYRGGGGGPRDGGGDLLDDGLLA